MRTSFIGWIALGIAMNTADAQHRTPASRLACDSTSFRLLLAGLPMGNEDVRIECGPKGATMVAHTIVSLTGLSSDITATVTTDTSLAARHIVIRGTTNSAAVNQDITLGSGTAVVVGANGRAEMPYAKGALYLGSNSPAPFALLLAAWDPTGAPTQTFNIFPALTASITRAGVVQATGPGGDRTFTQFRMLLGGAEVHAWLDDAGRLVSVMQPSAQFTAIREGLQDYVPALRKAMTTVSDATRASPAGQGASASDQPRNQSSAGPTLNPPVAPPADYRARPDANYTSEDVSIPVANYTLAGTLLVPKRAKGRVPAVVMITGSGLQDRDQSLPIPGLQGYRPFRQIAEALADAGVAVLRVDDRGFGQSTGRETLLNATTSKLADDTRAQIAWLRRSVRIDGDRIALVGHSEGGTIGPMVAATDPGIRAVVIMAGLAERGAETSKRQAEFMNAEDTTLTPEVRQARKEQQQQIIDAVLAGKDVPGIPMNDWIREFWRYDPLPTIRAVKAPILILQGARDTQVFPDNATRLAEAAKSSGNSDVTVKLFPTLNHLFLPATTGSFREYGHLATTMVPDDVIVTIRDWLTKRLVAR